MTIRIFAVSPSGKSRPGIAVALSHSKKHDISERETTLAVKQADRVGFISFKTDSVPEYGEFKLYVVGSPDSHIKLAVAHIPPVSVLEIPDSVPAEPTGSFPSGSCGDPGDVEISPESFAKTTNIEGNSECDLFLPGAQAERVYTYRQLAMKPSKPQRLRFAEGECFVDEKGPQMLDGRDTNPGPCYRKGVLLEYTSTWCAVGHALGEIAYSLPLAPCESVNLAVVDWSRDDFTKRTESTTQTESLSHDQRRDRVVEETVQASLKQTQRGFSVTGGASLGGVVSIGGGYSSSTGETDLHSQNTQSIADAVQQASSATRGIYSTVIVEASQAETDSAQTRTVTNNNHCHAMTVLYYEVLRRYLVRIELSKERHLILVQFDMPNFTEQSALCFRWLFEPVLLEPRLKDGFDALARTEFGVIPPDPSSFILPPLPTQPVTRLKVTTTTGTNAMDQSNVDFELFKEDGSTLISFDLDNESGDFIDEENDFEEGQTNIFEISVSGDWSPNDIATLGLQFHEWGGVAGIGGDEWQVAEITAHYKIEGDEEWHLLYKSSDDSESGLPKTLSGNGVWRRPVPREESVGPSPEELEARRAVSKWNRDIKQGQRLLHHLNCNREYYYRRKWEGEDPGNRAIKLAKLRYGDGRLIDSIENRVVAVVGDTIAFPLIKKDDPSEPLERADPVIRLVDLPTRGLFAEAKLSNCNVCEEKDVTKYWDWQESPCPDCAPEIAPVSLGSRDRPTSPEPTSFANPIVNITNPPSAPDPIGLSSALQLLGQSDLFRDMSMSSEVSDLVSDISSGAVTLEQARIRAQQIEAQRDRAGLTDTSRITSERRASPQSTHDAIQVTRDAVNKGNLSEEEGNQKISDMLDEMTGVTRKGGETLERQWYRENPGIRTNNLGATGNELLIWNFDIGSAELGTDSEIRSLNLDVERFFLNNAPFTYPDGDVRTDKILWVEGRSSSSGSDLENEALSINRIANVSSELISNSAPRPPEINIRTIPLGEGHPLLPDDTPEGMARNRSVRLIIEDLNEECEVDSEVLGIARTILERLLGSRHSIDPSTLWTPQINGIRRLHPVPTIPTRVFPSWYGSHTPVPDDPICVDRPSLLCMPNEYLSFTTLVIMLEAECRRSGVLNEETIGKIIGSFMQQSQQAINEETRLRNLFLRYPTFIGGMTSANDILARGYDRIQDQWFLRDPTCSWKYIHPDASP